MAQLVERRAAVHTYCDSVQTQSVISPAAGHIAPRRFRTPIREHTVPHPVTFFASGEALEAVGEALLPLPPPSPCLLLCTLL